MERQTWWINFTCDGVLSQLFQLVRHHSKLQEVNYRWVYHEISNDCQHNRSCLNILKGKKKKRKTDKNKQYLSIFNAAEKNQS